MRSFATMSAKKWFENAHPELRYYTPDTLVEFFGRFLIRRYDEPSVLLCEVYHQALLSTFNVYHLSCIDIPLEDFIELRADFWEKDDSESSRAFDGRLPSSALDEMEDLIRNAIFEWSGVDKKAFFKSFDEWDLDESCADLELDRLGHPVGLDLSRDVLAIHKAACNVVHSIDYEMCSVGIQSAFSWLNRVHGATQFTVETLMEFFAMFIVEYHADVPSELFCEAYLRAILHVFNVRHLSDITVSFDQFNAVSRLLWTSDNSFRNRTSVLFEAILNSSGVPREEFLNAYSEYVKANVVVNVAPSSIPV